MNLLNDQNVRPKIGIVTALPKEYVAVKALFDKPEEQWFPGQGAGRQYITGKVPGSNGGRHTVVLCLLSDMGNNSAATRTTLLLEHFPSIQSVIMVGIAGGVPNPDKPDKHVRLGDIVVSNRNGVVQYDFGAETINEFEDRHPPRPPSAELLEAVRLLEAKELEGKRPWLKFIKRALLPKGSKRPSEDTDLLMGTEEPRKAICHPRDPKRVRNQPRVFLDTIASANRVLKNPITRDQLRNKFEVRAVEMEGSGISDATWASDKAGYLVIRGICDYCDSSKGNEWQAYAAAVAAAYTRALLEAMPCFEEGGTEILEGQKRDENIKGLMARGRNEDSFITLSGDGVVKLDRNRIISYNLKDLRANLIDKIGYIGAFLFSIGEDYDILTRYLIPRIQKELSTMSFNSKWGYKEITLTSSIRDKLLSQSGEERIINCFELEKLGYHQLIDLFEDGPSDTLLVVYNRDFSVANIEALAADFQKKCTEIQKFSPNRPLRFVVVWANICSFEKKPLSCEGFIPVYIKHSEVTDLVAFFRKEMSYSGYDEEKNLTLKERIDLYCRELEEIRGLADAFRKLESIFSELSPKELL